MFSTLRNRLGIALGMMLFITLGLALLLYWSAQQTQAYLIRGQYAHAQLESYLNLSLQAQRHFEQLLQWVTLGVPVAHDAIELPLHLQDALQHLTELTEKEIQLLPGERDKNVESEELERINQFNILLQELTRLAFEIHNRANDGLSPRSWQALTQALQQNIDVDFRHLIDEALSDEREEVRQVEQRGEALSQRLSTIATVVTLLSIVLALMLGSFLFRSIKSPIDNLLAGTTKLGEGQLGYRIALAGPRELRQLAESFNTMSAELERQQQNLLEAQAGLEKKVAERTQELHDANQELKRLDQTRRQFFADISHELRTPLTIILGEAEVTLRGNDKAAPEYQAVLRRIVELSQQLSRLVNDLLLIARSDSMITRTEVKTLYLDQLLQQTCENAQSLAQSRNQTISLALSDRQLPVRGDAQRLQQLLMIFIDNACRYSATGQDIVLSLEKDADEAVIEISDNGIGITADDLEHIFERRYRGANAQAVAPLGNGLGLPVAKSIAMTHQGSIDINSVANGGTTVTVRLPLAEKVSECVFS